MATGEPSEVDPYPDWWQFDSLFAANIILIDSIDRLPERAGESVIPVYRPVLAIPRTTVSPRREGAFRPPLAIGAWLSPRRADLSAAASTDRGSSRGMAARGGIVQKFAISTLARFCAANKGTFAAVKPILPSIREQLKS
jgi:hypothetical protein